MLKLNNSQLALLQLLGDGSCHSGIALGKTLGISRSAIWKQINQLLEAGIPVKRIAHKGYQLSNPLILLNDQKINNFLQIFKFPSIANLHIFNSIDSTNKFLKELPATKNVDICCAEIQSQGRGRFGRHWHSPFGENIYCSSRWNLHCDLSRLSGLSLVSSLAVLSTIKELSPLAEAQIKWPNDILWHNKKLCGSLIEVMAESNGIIQVIIGIGLNVHSDTKNQPLADSTWCSLMEITERRFDRNELVAKLMCHLAEYLSQFIEAGIKPFIEEWHNYDYLKGKFITVSQSTGSQSGTACGINELGQLILKDNEGKIHYISSGDASLKTR